MAEEPKKTDEKIQIGQEVMLKKQKVRGTIFSMSTSLKGVISYNIQARNGQKYSVKRKDFLLLGE